MAPSVPSSPRSMVGNDAGVGLASPFFRPVVTRRASSELRSAPHGLFSRANIRVVGENIDDPTAVQSYGPTVAPGWYADSATPGQRRYWDGSAWAATPPPELGRGSRLAQQPAALWFALAASAFMVIGVLGTWVTALNFLSISGTQGADGLLVLGTAAFGAALLGGYAFRRLRILLVFAVLCGAVGALAAGYDLHRVASGGTSDFFGRQLQVVKPGWGLYLDVGASIALTGFAALLVAVTRGDAARQDHLSGATTAFLAVALVLFGAGAAFAVGTIGKTATTTDTGSATSTAANTTSASPTTDSTATRSTSTSHAVQKFHGDGQKNLGTIVVPDDSTISWKCPSCGSTNFSIHNASSDDSNIPTNALNQTRGVDPISAGTYHTVVVDTTGGPWTVAIGGTAPSPTSGASSSSGSTQSPSSPQGAYTPCDSNIAVSGGADCGLAQNTFYEYWSHHGASTFSVYNPTAHSSSTVTCSTTDSIVCSTDQGGGVRFSQGSVDSYTQSQATATPAPTTWGPRALLHPCARRVIAVADGRATP